MTTKTVDIIGDGTESDPYRPDISGDYDNAEYDFDNGTVDVDVNE